VEEVQRPVLYCHALCSRILGMFEISSDLALELFKSLYFPYVGDKRLTLPERMRDYTTDR
jgi:hypothetical protein